MGHPPKHYGWLSGWIRIRAVTVLSVLPVFYHSSSSSYSALGAWLGQPNTFSQLAITSHSVYCAVIVDVHTYPHGEYLLLLISYT